MFNANHLISPFTFDIKAEGIRRYVHSFDVTNYKQQIRRYLSSSSEAKNDVTAGSSPRSPSTLPSPSLSDEIFMTPTTELRHNPFKVVKEEEHGTDKV